MKRVDQAEQPAVLPSLRLKTKYSKLLAVVQNEVRRRGELAEEDAQQPGREMSAATPALPIGCESQPPGAAQQQAADPMLPEASGDAGGEGVRQTTSATRGHAPQPDAPSASPGVPPPTTDKPRAPQPSRARRHRATLPTLDCAECAKVRIHAASQRTLNRLCCALTRTTTKRHCDSRARYALPSSTPPPASAGAAARVVRAERSSQRSRRRNSGASASRRTTPQPPRLR